jgi:hypothetical protein
MSEIKHPDRSGPRSRVGECIPYWMARFETGDGAAKSEPRIESLTGRAAPVEQCVKADQAGLGLPTNRAVGTSEGFKG